MAINLQKGDAKAPINTWASFRGTSVEIDTEFFKALILKANSIKLDGNSDFYEVLNERIKAIANHYKGKDMLYQVSLLNHFIGFYAPENAINQSQVVPGTE